MCAEKRMLIINAEKENEIIKKRNEIKRLLNEIDKINGEILRQDGIKQDLRKQIVKLKQEIEEMKNG